MIHELKLQQPYFDEVWNNRKTFEIRKNDRDFKVSDTVILKEYDYFNRI
jgi:ASC-1-like (ASCH) protein